MKQQVLMVEDEQDTAELVKTILEREGFSVLHARDGRQATTLIETMRAPSLILLDMVIPYANGFEVLNAIRHRPDWQEVPVIMLSANYYEPDIQRALREGATTYVMKQPGLQDLVQAVSQILPSPVPTAPVPDRTALKAATMNPRKRGTSACHRPRGSLGKKRAA